MRKYLLISLIVCSFCTGDKDEDFNERAQIPVITPSSILEISNADTAYFEHLGYSSVVLNNGDIFIPDRENPALLVIDTKGNLKKMIRGGRGPGEVLDAYNLVTDASGNVSVFDQDNKKIITFDGAANFIKEFVPPPVGNNFLQKMYTIGEQDVIFELSSYEFLINPEINPALTLTHFNTQTGTFGKEVKFKDRPFARFIVEGKIAGGVWVPYTNSNLLYYYSVNNTIFSFDTETEIIAELNSDFDTLKVIPVQLPKEKLSRATKDSLKSTYNTRLGQWKTLEPMLPEYKAIADKMMIYDDQIWLKTNLGEDPEEEKWLVLTMDGEILGQVHLPNKSMLTHISNEHLGVRLDAYTFALFEPVNF